MLTWPDILGSKMKTLAAKALRAAKPVASRSTQCSIIYSRSASTKPSTNNQPSTLTDQNKNKQAVPKVGKDTKKTVAEQDEELRRKLEGISGDGGEAGLELENGQPVAMKRSVKENMFRLI